MIPGISTSLRMRYEHSDNVTQVLLVELPILNNGGEAQNTYLNLADSDLVTSLESLKTFMNSNQRNQFSALNYLNNRDYGHFYTATGNLANGNTNVIFLVNYFVITLPNIPIPFAAIVAGDSDITPSSID